VLGRNAGLSDAQIRHVGDEQPPDGLYDEASTALLRYVRASARMEQIDDEMYGALVAHFTRDQIMELCFEVGLAGTVNRFHATFLTDLDAETAACPVPDLVAEAAQRGWKRSTGSAD
jgi:alkylhydroperoxidase family enzyme